MEMETAWYFRLLIPWIGWFVFNLILLAIIKPKRMSGPGGSKPLEMVSYISIIAGWVLAWFIPYSINMAFWIGLGIIILGLIISSLSFTAMREYPERKQAVVDWGIYRASRHSHVLSSMICILGTVVMGWNPDLVIYIILWVYFVLYATLLHFWVLSEEKLNIERFGQEYIDYTKRVPRYFWKIR
jgi:protein-S-isoprenylcysteine O-methyltransferase Ste14